MRQYVAIKMLVTQLRQCAKRVLSCDKPFSLKSIRPGKCLFNKLNCAAKQRGELCFLKQIAELAEAISNSMLDVLILTMFRSSNFKIFRSKRGDGGRVLVCMLNEITEEAKSINYLVFSHTAIVLQNSREICKGARLNGLLSTRLEYLNKLAGEFHNLGCHGGHSRQIFFDTFYILFIHFEVLFALSKYDRSR